MYSLESYRRGDSNYIQQLCYRRSNPSLNYSHLPPDLALCLELALSRTNFHFVPNMIQPLKLDLSSGHMTVIQCRINVDATLSQRCVVQCLFVQNFRRARVQVTHRRGRNQTSRLFFFFLFVFVFCFFFVVVVVFLFVCFFVFVFFVLFFLFCFVFFILILLNMLPVICLCQTVEIKYV